ncbi:MAG: hypothetical protein MK116_10020 [Phycisphaerales bacterium]|nr:hypothetical protein [Phycisphaerales bacterium]
MSRLDGVVIMNPELSQRCLDALGHSPTVMASAPGRVNLLGDHVDYCGGPVLPMAIEQRTMVAVGPAEGSLSTLITDDLGDRVTIALGSPGVMDEIPRGFARHVAGCIRQLKQAGVPVDEMDLAIASDIPIGAGLSSSAALEVATLLAVSTMHGVSIDPVRMAKMAMAVEHDDIGTPCGIMDMLVATVAKAGHACLIDTVTLEIEHIAMPPPGEAVVLIVDTGTRHDLAAGAYADRRAATERAAAALGLSALAQIEPAQVSSLPPDLQPMARHVAREVSLVHQAVESLRHGDLVSVGQAMSASHASLRDDARVSCPELDAVVGALSRFDDVHGARMTGGGFGGCVVALARPEMAADRGAVAAEAAGPAGRFWISAAGPSASIEG